MILEYLSSQLEEGVCEVSAAVPLCVGLSRGVSEVPCRDHSHIPDLVIIFHLLFQELAQPCQMLWV